MAKPKYEPSTLEGENYMVKGKDKTRLEQIIHQNKNRSANEE